MIWWILKLDAGIDVFIKFSKTDKTFILHENFKKNKEKDKKIKNQNFLVINDNRLMQVPNLPCS